MQIAPLALEVYMRYTVIKHVDYCNREYGVQGFHPRFIGERKVLRVGKACCEQSGAMP